MWPCQEDLARDPAALTLPFLAASRGPPHWETSGRLPGGALGLTCVCDMFSCSVISTLRNREQGAADRSYCTLLDCLCAWGRVGHVLELVCDWLPEECPQGKVRSCPGSRSAGGAAGGADALLGLGCQCVALLLSG